jgi:hypothetical protein
MQRLKSAMILLGGVLSMAACAPTQLSENYGETYYTMLEGQILNPKAGRYQDPVTGMDGKASMTATEAYRKTFEKRDVEFERSMISTGVQTR